MNIPGQLAKTTLGDVLGGLHRAEISGVLELIEGGGSRVHRIFLSHGLVDAVETPLAAQALAAQALAARAPGDHGVLERLEAMFRIREAAVRFSARRLGVPGLLKCQPLVPAEFLHGRPRARARASALPRSERSSAYRLLGLEASASRADVQSAFRKLARVFHPDRHPRATPREREALKQRFALVSAAYHSLEQG